MWGKSGQRAGRGVVQDDGDHGRLQGRRAFDGQVERGRGLGFNPVTEAAERSIRLQSRADGGDQVIKRAGPAGTRLDDDLQLGPVLIVIAQRRQRHFRLARLAIAQDDQPGGRDPLRQDLVTQG